MFSYITFPEGRSKTLTMSYDDGRIHDKRLVEIFNKYGIKGTFHLNSGWMDPELVKMREEAVKLYEGHEIATHSLTHPTLTRLSDTALVTEILEDRKNLEKLTGRIIRGHSYPNGAYNENVKQILKSLGIVYARAVSSTNDFEMPEDFMEWHPTCHHSAPDLMEKAKWLVEFNKAQYLKLFYVWGHSYEFDRDNSWGVIEEFCEYMSGHDDIWYATNIEIVDYMKAARGLIWSADGSHVYNPYACDVWIRRLSNEGPEMGDVLKVPGGKGITLE